MAGRPSAGSRAAGGDGAGARRRALHLDRRRSDWTVVDGVTTQHSHSYLVVMNPFTLRRGHRRDPVPARRARRCAAPTGPTCAVEAGSLRRARSRRRALGKKIVGADVIGRPGPGRASARSWCGTGAGALGARRRPANASRWILPVTGGTRRRHAVAARVRATSASASAPCARPGHRRRSPPATSPSSSRAATSTMSAPSRHDRPLGGPRQSRRTARRRPPGLRAAGPRRRRRGDRRHREPVPPGSCSPPPSGWIRIAVARAGEPRRRSRCTATVTLLRDGGGEPGDPIRSRCRRADGAVPRVVPRKPTDTAAIAGRRRAATSSRSGPGRAASGPVLAMALGVPVPAAPAHRAPNNGGIIGRLPAQVWSGIRTWPKDDTSIDAAVPPVLIALAAVIGVGVAGVRRRRVRGDALRTRARRPDHARASRSTGIDVSGMTRARSDRGRPSRSPTPSSRKPLTVTVGTRPLDGRRRRRSAGARRSPRRCIGRCRPGGTSARSTAPGTASAASPLGVDVPLDFTVDGRRGRPISRSMIAHATYVAPRATPRSVSRPITPTSRSSTRARRQARSGGGRGRRSGRPRQHERARVRLHTAPVQPKVTEARWVHTIVVRVDQNRLYLYDGFKVVRSLLGRDREARVHDPDRRVAIYNKAENPTWYNPALDSWGAGPAGRDPRRPRQPDGHPRHLHHGARADPHPRHDRRLLDRPLRLARVHPDAQQRGRAALSAGRGGRPRDRRREPPGVAPATGASRPPPTSERAIPPGCLEITAV